MKTNSSFLNIPVILLLRRLLLALFLLSLARIVFWIFNSNQFVWPGFHQGLMVLFWGFYFDTISLFYCLSPFILIHLIPGNWFYNTKIQAGIKLFFMIILFAIFTLTFIDAGYFPFSKSRLSVELFQMAGTEEISIFQYILDYWWFVPVILGMVYLAWKFYPKVNSISELKWYFQIPINILVLALLVLTIRGGFRLKPLRSIDTVLFVPSSYSQLSVSTGFNLLESLRAETISVPNFFNENELNKIMLDDYYVISNNQKLKKKNIVIIILESFGKEYSFPQATGVVSYTPFLQQLASQSEFYTHAYANGTRSVDAIPAILEGIPKLTKTDFLYSNYINNTTPGFPFYLNKLGYTCNFYHGGKNGTMSFESFLKSRGWNYYGKNEYVGRHEDFDGQWGIYDGPYFKYFAQQIGQIKKPFVSVIFTLSSHHPYNLPSHYSDSFKTIKKPIHKTVRYADNCLRHFFDIIKTEPWYNETIFIITGDHSGENFTKTYQTNDGKYEVPILVFDPSNPVPKVINEIIQHIDILPLALDRAGYSGKIFTLGTYFKSQKMAFQNDEGIFQGINANMPYTFNGSKFYWPTKKPINNANMKLAEFELKAKIHNYNYRMVNNLFY